MCWGGGEPSVLSLPSLLPRLRPSVVSLRSCGRPWRLFAKVAGETVMGDREGVVSRRRGARVDGGSLGCQMVPKESWYFYDGVRTDAWCSAGAGR